MVSEKDALEILRVASDAGIAVWLDGGWGVDALVGRETRAHDDIDLFARGEDCARLARLLEARGFSEVVTPFSTPDHTVWRDAAHRVVDLHRFELADDGEILYGGERFPGDVFSGTGAIGGTVVRCVEPASQLSFHLGYQHDENDAHDVALLCETFGFDVPEEYR